MAQFLSPVCFGFKHALFEASKLKHVLHYRYLSYSLMKGLVLGVYTKKVDSCNEISEFTKAFTEVDKICNGKISEFVKITGPFCKSAKQKLFWTSHIKEIDFDCLSVVDLGDKDFKVNPLEDLDEKADRVRSAISVGVKVLRSSSNFEKIYLDPCGFPKSAAEASLLSVFSYDALKQESSHSPKSEFHLFDYNGLESNALSEFQKGVIVAEAQNFARTLMETPANHLTPTIFAKTASEKFQNSAVTVIVRDKEWIESMNMGSFLSVSKGSDEPPTFIEMHYNGAPDSEKCIAFVGKGVTFDSGGISIKPSLNMDAMRGDMGGAACVTATIFAASQLKLKVNLKGFIPLTENLINGKASKPGDVVRAMNGKSIQIDNTDAEGRLILADGICYAQSFKPMALIDIATLTGAMMISLGGGAAGVFSNDDSLWESLHKAGYATGDRVWRLPLYSLYKKQVTSCHLADLNNISNAGSAGGSCTAAAFLSEFVESDTKWMHIDIAGVMTNKDHCSYLSTGMSGRPVRTLVEFVESLQDRFTSAN